VLGLALVLLGLPVHWDAPQGCASAEEFVRRVLEQTDAEVDDTSAIAVAVTVRERPGGRWIVLLDLDGVDAREIEGESCDAVVDAAALIVSLRLVEAARGDVVPPAEDPTPGAGSDDPREGPDVSEVGSRGGSRTSSEVVPREVVPREGAREDMRSNAIAGFLAIAAGPALGVLPRVGAGVSLDGGVQGRWWRAGASVRAFPVRTAPHPTVADVRGRFDLVVAGVLGCGQPAVRRVSFPLCARVDVGGLRAIGEGDVTDPRPRWSPWVGLAASVGVSWRIVRQVAPFVAVEGVASLYRPSFSIGGVADPLFEVGAGGFRAWAGIELHFGPEGRAGQIGTRNPVAAQTQ
jgi:hypothetical protein